MPDRRSAGWVRTPHAHLGRRRRSYPPGARRTVPFRSALPHGLCAHGAQRPTGRRPRRQRGGREARLWNDVIQRNPYAAFGTAAVHLHAAARHGRGGCEAVRGPAFREITTRDAGVRDSNPWVTSKNPGTPPVTAARGSPDPTSRPPARFTGVPLRVTSGLSHVPTTARNSSKSNRGDQHSSVLASPHRRRRTVRDGGPRCPADRTARRYRRLFDASLTHFTARHGNVMPSPRRAGKCCMVVPATSENRTFDGWPIRCVRTRRRRWADNRTPPDGPSSLRRPMCFANRAGHCTGRPATWNLTSVYVHGGTEKTGATREMRGVTHTAVQLLAYEFGCVSREPSAVRDLPVTPGPHPSACADPSAFTARDGHPHPAPTRPTPSRSREGRLPVGRLQQLIGGGIERGHHPLL